MTNLSISEKKALEEVFIVLDTRKNRKIEYIRRYFMFYKCMRMLSGKKLLPIRGL